MKNLNHFFENSVDPDQLNKDPRYFSLILKNSPVCGYYSMSAYNVEYGIPCSCMDFVEPSWRKALKTSFLMSVTLKIHLEWPTPCKKSFRFIAS